MNMQLRIFPLALLANVACGPSDGTATDDGTCSVSVEGGALSGLSTENTCEYRGVPFAKPPVGPLRFAPPEPAAPWEGTRDATRFGSICSQPMYGVVAFVTSSSLSAG